ncbi:phosphatidylglycerol lysyltransferase domain-containing protein [Chloroflexota bacterium]
MITPSERAYIRKHAYVPEHLPDYVCAISQTEPFLIGDFVVHVSATHLVFVGYPLQKDQANPQMIAALDQAKARFNPAVTSVIAPDLPPTLEDYTPSPPDEYYRLDLSQLAISKKTRNMLRRARREVSISAGSFGREHKKLIKAFLHRSRFDRATRFIFQRASEYAKCDTAHVYEARTARGDLVAFDIAEFGAQAYAFYMFNFRSRKFKIPGVSDLLLAHIIERAQAEGKRYLNLGLGINAGIAYFKKKWGGTPFLKYTTWSQESPEQISWWQTLDQLSR